jgi:hypothetical protein
LILVALSACGGLSVSAGGVGKMKIYETPDYTLVAIDNQPLLKYIPKLAQVSRAMEVALDIKAVPNSTPTYIYVVSNTIWDKYLEPSNSVLSEFVPTRFANYVLGNTLTFGRYELFHQYSHLFVHNQLIGAYPLWFDEGLAMMMSRARYDPDNSVNFYASRGVTEGGWIPTDRLLRVTRESPEYLNQGSHGSFTFQSRVMVHRALIEQPAFGKQVFNYLMAINQYQSVENAAESSFGESLDDLDGQIRAYVDRTYRGHAKIKMAPVPDVPPGEGRKLPELEALQSLAHMMLDTGYGTDRLLELLDSAERLSPGNLRTRLLRLRLSAQLADDASLASQLAALDAQLKEPTAARAAGLALFDRFLGKDSQTSLADPRLAGFRDKSFELLDVSLARAPKDPEAAWAYANLAAATARDLDNALMRLTPAFEMMPRSSDIPHAAALVLAARKQYKEMIPFLLATARFAHTFDEKVWAKETLELLQKGAVPTGM